MKMIPQLYAVTERVTNTSVQCVEMVKIQKQLQT